MQVYMVQEAQEAQSGCGTRIECLFVYLFNGILIRRCCLYAKIILDLLDIHVWKYMFMCYAYHKCNLSFQPPNLSFQPPIFLCHIIF